MKIACLTAGGEIQMVYKLYNIAQEYIKIIEEIERTSDKNKLIRLEEKRIIWHNKLLDVLNNEGIKYRDREHVTKIAYKIVRKEL